MALTAPADLEEARVHKAPDDLMEGRLAEPGPDDVGDEVGVGVGHHDGEREQDLPLGRSTSRGNARVQREPEPVTTTRGTPGPPPEVGLDP